MNEQGEKHKGYLLPASILISGILIAGSIVYLVGNQGAPRDRGSAGAGEDAGSAPLISERDVILGDPKAPVSFIEYADFQCPFCGRFFSQTESQIRENYIKTGKVKMVYRNFAFLGPESFAAAEAAECAKDQRQFWAYHDVLYEREIDDGKENNGNLTRDLFLELANELGLDAKAFTACVDGKKYAESVQKESAEAQAAGVNSTPTVFINGRKIQGALPYQQFKAVIDTFLTPT